MIPNASRPEASFAGTLSCCSINHWSRVNGADSTTGPTGDNDTLDVDLDYAAAAAHIEAWHLFPDRLVLAAAGGTQATQQQAAAEFVRQVSFWGPSRPTRIGFQQSFYGATGGY